MFDLKLKFVALKYFENILKYSTQNFEVEFVYKSQCARTDLNKRFLPMPMTTTG